MQVNPGAIIAALMKTRHTVRLHCRTGRTYISIKKKKKRQNCYKDEIFFFSIVAQKYHMMNENQQKQHGAYLTEVKIQLCCDRSTQKRIESFFKEIHIKML